MKKIKDILDEYNINILKYSYKNTAVIIDSDNGKVVLKKKKKNDKKELYDYLLSRNFSFFLYFHCLGFEICDCEVISFYLL